MVEISQLRAKALAGFNPPPKLSLDEWADKHFYLSPESAADPGPWRSLPYQRGIMQAISDKTIERVSLKKSARVGYTKILDATIGYYAHHDPCPILLVQPTVKDAEDFSKEEIFPMLRDCPVLAEIFLKPKPGDPNATTLHKVFRGGVLQMVSANTPASFRRVSRKVILLDEVDAYPSSAGKEGDPIRLATRRSEYYWDRKIIAGSTPTVQGHSKIDDLYEQGDQRKYHVPCPHCEYMQPLEFKQLKWPKGKPHEAKYACIDCGTLIDHRHKRDMVAKGEWVAAKPGNLKQNRHASFHIWAAYSFSPNATWGHIAAEFVQADKEGPEALKTFVNTVLGESWRDRGEAPDWQLLYDRREDYPITVAPEPVVFLTCGVDVQKDRLIFEVVGWCRDRRTYSVDQGQLMGDTAGPEVWKLLDGLLGHQFDHANGGKLGISVLAVDSGYNTQQVYSWARQYPMTRVLAVKGQDKATVLLGMPSPVDVTQNGRRMARAYKVWPVGVNVAKAELYGWLRLQKPTDEEREAGVTEAPGFCHFPQYGEEYFKQLTAEQWIPHKSRQGFVKMEWELIPGRENHILDCRVYNRAAAVQVGIDRFTADDWTQLEAAVAPEAETIETQSGGTTPPRGGRIGKRPKGWLKGGR